MYSEEDLASAVKAGILTPDSVTALRSHVSQLRAAPAMDEEQFRLIAGFSDIFVVVACALLLTALSLIGNALAPWVGPLSTAAATWGLGEFFIRKRRMALPAIFLLAAFVYGVVATTAALNGLQPLTTTGSAAGFALGSLAALLHWRRFQVPITVALGTATVFAAILITQHALLPQFMANRHGVALEFFVLGLIAFALAMGWDSADRMRLTRKSDTAFWLHMLAAPLLVHPVFAEMQVFSTQLSAAHALACIAIYILIAFISLAIDRRALMLSALAYVLYTFSLILREYGVVSLGFAIAALVISAALLLLSALWHRSRAFVVNYLPAALRRYLPPLH